MFQLSFDPLGLPCASSAEEHCENRFRAFYELAPELANNIESRLPPVYSNNTAVEIWAYVRESHAPVPVL